MKPRWADGELSDAPRKSIFANLLWAVTLLLAVYILSYAPVVRMSDEDSVFENKLIRAGDVGVADGAQFPLFSPVDSIIDETPLRTPLLHWADLWGVRLEFEMGESIRQLAGDPPEQLSNRQVAIELNGRLRQSRVRGHGIEIMYSDARATLFGEMESAEDREAAVRTVLDHTSVSTVENHLEVRR